MKSIRGLSVGTVAIALVCAFVMSIAGTAAWRVWEAKERSDMSKQPTPASQPPGSPQLSAVTVSLFKNAADAINRDTANAYTRLAASPDRRSDAFRIARGAELSRQIDGHLKRLGDQAGPTMRLAMSDSAKRGVADANRQIRELGLRDAARDVGLSAGGQGFALIDAGAIETIARDSLASTMRAAGAHGENARAVFHKLSDSTRLGSRNAEVNEAIARGIITGDPRSTQRALRLMQAEPGVAALAESDAKAYRRLGAQQIEVGGWTGTVADYAEIVAVTRTREATVEARHDRLLAGDIHLVQITGANSINFCTRFLGLVCALDDASTDGGKYPLLDSLPGGGPPFHPRCSKGTVAFVPELASDTRRGAHEKALGGYRLALAAGTLETPLNVARRRTG